MQISSAAGNAVNQRTARYGEQAGIVGIKQDLQAQQAVAQLISGSLAQAERQQQEVQTRPAPGVGKGSVLDIIV